MAEGIYSKLFEAGKQLEFAKTKGNQSYATFDADSVFPQIARAFENVGILFVPEMIDSHVSWDSTPNGKIVSRALAVMKLRFIDIEDGSVMTMETQGSAQNYGDKALGAAQTYAIKYALLNMFLRADNKMDNDLAQGPSELDEIYWTSEPGTAGKLLNYVDEAHDTKSPQHTVNLAAKALRLSNCNGSEKKFAAALAAEYKGSKADAARDIDAYESES